MSSLNDVKPGDILVECKRNYIGIGTVSKITPTQIVLDNNSRYRKKDGYLVGRDAWNYGRVRIPEKGQVESIRKSEFISKVVTAMHRTQRNDLTYEQVLKIAEILNIPSNF